MLTDSGIISMLPVAVLLPIWSTHVLPMVQTCEPVRLLIEEWRILLHLDWMTSSGTFFITILWWLLSA